MAARDDDIPLRNPVLPYVDLTNVATVATGKVREVYLRPGQPDALIKRTMSHHRRDWQKRTGIVAWLKRRRPIGPYAIFPKEYRAYLHAAAMADRHGRPIPIPEFGGLVRTESSLAQVSRLVPDGQGGLAPTVSQLSRKGRLDRQMVERMNAFVSDIYALNVVAPDLNHVNIVLDGSGGAGRFVLIHGFGEKGWLPWRAWLPRLNARILDRQFARLAKVPPLLWLPRERRFAFRDDQQPRQIQPPPSTRVPPGA